MRRRSMIGAMGTLLVVGVQQAIGMTLVKDGAPQAVVVVQAESAKSMEAAEALRKYIETMSGATLPLVVEGDDMPADEPRGRVHVGHTSAAKGQKVPSGFDPSVREDSFEEEGYVLRTLNNNTLLVAGNNDGEYRGTIFAAYALLKQLGCRFYFPGEWGEIVPERQTVVVPELDVLSRPDFALRHIPLSGWIRTTREEKEIYREWGKRVGFSVGRLYPPSNDGSLGGLLPHREYFAEHPEFFAMGKDQQRRAGSMYCLSNEDMIEEVVARLRRGFAGEEKVGNISEPWPGSEGAGFSPPDGTPYCYCSECVENAQNFMYARYENRPDRPMMSEEFFSFAARIAREFPDKWIATGAYSLREAPPPGVDLPDNVAIWHAPITCDVLHPNNSQLWRRSEFVSWLSQWREQTPHLYIYDYNPGFLTGMFLPERDAENMAINAPIYRDIDIKGMRREGRKAFMQTWISYYVTAKMLWDADADLEAIKQDFYPTFFGADVAPHVRAWWDACAERLVNSTMQAHEDWLVNHLYNKEFADRIHKHVEAALKAKATEAQKERVRAFALIAENLESYANMHAAIRELDWKTAAKHAGRMSEIKHELHAIYPFFMQPEREERTRPFFAEGYQKRFLEFADLTNGTTGTLVAELPLEMEFSRDPFNEGVVRRWYRPDHDTADWETKNSFYLLEQQEEPLNERGFHYSGYVWYRTTVRVPRKFRKSELQLRIGGLINEGWVWINGEYVGHRPWTRWWKHSAHPAEFAVGDVLKPGKKNTIAIRVLNTRDEVGGLYRRGFIYQPIEQKTAGEEE